MEAARRQQLTHGEQLQLMQLQTLLMALVITLDAPRQGLLPEVEEAQGGGAKAWPSRSHQ